MASSRSSSKYSCSGSSELACVRQVQGLQSHGLEVSSAGPFDIVVNGLCWVPRFLVVAAATGSSCECAAGMSPMGEQLWIAAMKLGSTYALKQLSPCNTFIRSLMLLIIYIRMVELGNTDAFAELLEWEGAMT